MAQINTITGASLLVNKMLGRRNKMHKGKKHNKKGSKSGRRSPMGKKKSGRRK
jgi:hypothetical protein